MRRLVALLALAAACKGAGVAKDPQATEQVAPPALEQETEPAADLAPELDGAVAWLGVDAPLTLAQLRGHVVILDFWTYCCVNCMHVLPLLREVEDTFAAEPVVVIGVHSAKFDGERDPARIRDAMDRYGVRHPVAVDSDLALWRAYNVEGWPTLAIIGPDGRKVVQAPGEPSPALVHEVIRGALAQGRAEGTLTDKPRQVLRATPKGTGALWFPGKVAVLPDGKLAIADSGHHRVLITDKGGRVVHTIGTGLRGWADGPMQSAAFDDPQGLAVGRALFVADARNHVVRRVDLKARRVSTIAGTGALGEGRLPTQPAPARSVALRSPWALARNGAGLVVANAGSHQLARVDVETGTLARYAGSGREAITDGSLEASAFAQPSGLAVHADALYVADSETSAVRVVRGGEVSTLVGTGLFDFGDRDGAFAAAQLQHPLGVVWDGSGVLVADTYNHKIKRLDPATRTATTFYGDAALREPGGLAVEADGSVIVADTGHHRVVRIDPGGRKASAVEVSGAPEALTGTATRSRARPSGPTRRIATTSTSPVAPGPVEFVIAFVTDDAHEFSAGSPLDASLKLPGDAGAPLSEHHGTAAGGRRTQVSFAGAVTEHTKGELELEVRAVVCDAKRHEYCSPIRETVLLAAPPVANGGGNRARYRVDLRPSDKL